MSSDELKSYLKSIFYTNFKNLPPDCYLKDLYNIAVEEGWIVKYKDKFRVSGAIG